MENYLEAIYELSKQTSFARISDIAAKLGVTKASASSAVQTLMARGYVTTEKYREVYLTAEGQKLAEITSKKHNTVKKFFMCVLELDERTADLDACAIEHVVSAATVRAMEKYLKKQQ